ncbi:tyrosine recombinase XerC [Micromonospora sp. NPDC049102]|uniref:site-specific integrase n=1 Tax=Micromonospora sp. NPDC049102 TaxID=3364265 RepID=UPI003714460D
MELDHGRWYFAVQVTNLDDRRVRIRRGGFRSSWEAERASWEFLQLPDAQAASEWWTLGRWLEYWLSELDGQLRPTTLMNYRSIVKNHLLPKVSKLRMPELRTRHLQRAMDSIARQRTAGGHTLSPGTLDRIRAVLRSALSEARRRGVLKTNSNPARGLRLPNGARPRAVLWDDDHEEVWRETGIRPRVAVWDLPHVGKFLESTRNDPMFALWWLVALHGLRRGEVAGLRWEDVDLAAGRLTVREQVIVLRGMEITGPPKSAAGVRVIELDEFTVEVLRALWNEQRRRFGSPSPKARMFRHANGRVVRPDWLTRRFARLVEELGLPPVRLHDLRHGATGIALASGSDLKVIQEKLGHSTPITTIEIYACVIKSLAQASVRAAAELLLSHVGRRRLSFGSASQA